MENLDARARYRDQVLRCYSVLEGQLAKSGGKSILPGGVTSVDLHWIVWTAQPHFLGLSFEKYPSMEKWASNMMAMKEVQAAFAKVQEAAQAAGTANMDADGKISGADKSLLRAIKEGQRRQDVGYVDESKGARLGRVPQVVDATLKIK